MKKISELEKAAQQRAKRRKSPWNLVLIPLGLVGIVAGAFLIGKLLLALQSTRFPPETILSSYTRAGSILMFVPILFPSLGAGMILANLAAWLIPPARKTFAQEARGHKNASFKKSLKLLSIITVCAGIAVTPLALLGTFNYFYVTQNGIFYNPLFSLSETHYRWQDIKEIHTRCLTERRNLHVNYKLIMSDQKSIDLMEEPRLDFVRAYPAIRPFLKEQHPIAYKKEITKQGKQRLFRLYKAEDARKILKILQDTGPRPGDR